MLKMFEKKNCGEVVFHGGERNTEQNASIKTLRPQQ